MHRNNIMRVYTSTYIYSTHHNIPGKKMVWYIVWSKEIDLYVREITEKTEREIQSRRLEI